MQKFAITHASTTEIKFNMPENDKTYHDIQALKEFYQKLSGDEFWHSRGIPLQRVYNKPSTYLVKIKINTEYLSPVLAWLNNFAKQHDFLFVAPDEKTPLITGL